MSKSASLLCLLGLLFSIGCSDPQGGSSSSPAVLTGNWKHVSLVYSGCSDPADNKSENCSGTASECGILTLTSTTWTWTKTPSGGTKFTESGTYYLSANYIILTGGSGTPDSRVHSISGSTLNYTSTTLTLINTNLSKGCGYTEMLSRYTQPFTPGQ